MNILNFILALQGGAEGEGGGYQSMMFLVLIIVVFYFFMIRPQMKKNKDLKKFREGLKKGDKIVTIGGIHGKIVEMQETTATIEVEGEKSLRIETSAISKVGQGQQIGRK